MTLPLSMDEYFFARRATDSRCRSVDVARRIRRYAVKKNGNEEDVSDSNLLPIPSKVKEAFRSQDDISQLLRCPCRGLCEPFSQDVNPGEDDELARDTWKRKRRLQTLAVLVLSGCLFAYRIYHEYEFQTLDAFIHAVRSEHETRLRQLLFAPIAPGGDTSDEALQTLADEFYGGIMSKLWLVRIPEFVTGGQPQHFPEHQWNFPFLKAQMAHREAMTNNVRKFVIHEDYFNSTELKNRQVFCKTASFRPGDSVLREDPIRETEILAWLNSLKHRNIAELLFLFTETSDVAHHFNLVFKYHRYTLADLFAQPRSEELLGRFRLGQATAAAYVSVLDHGLWTAMLDVLDAVRAMHELSSKNGPYEYDETVEVGHFDIKPANILVSDDAGPPRLLLTDFGQVHLQRRYLDTAERRQRGMATGEYAPPECQLGAFSQGRLKASYDIWSLGCVLLEVLVFVVNDFDGRAASAAVHQFRLERLAASGQSEMSCAVFWYGEQLLPCVTRRIQMLKDRKDDHLQEVLLQIERMLNVKDRDRPNIAACLGALNSDRRLFMRSAHDDMSRRLKDMTISFQTAKMFSPMPCSLFLWRESIDREMELTMILEFAQYQRWSDSKTLEHDALIVESFYDSRLHFTRSEQNLHLACRFRRLHRGTTFHFASWKEFSTFFHLMTQQQLASGKSQDKSQRGPASPVDKPPRSTISPRWGFRFQSISLRDKTKHGRGIVQIWSTDTSARHSEIFARQPTGSSSDIVQRRPSQSVSETRSSVDARHARFKLAMFVAREGPGGEVLCEVPTCYVIEPDLNDIVRGDDPKDAQAVVFRAKDRIMGSFPVWAPGLKDRSFDGGLPLSPHTLNASIRESPATIRLKELKIAFMSAEELTNFKNALRSYGL